MSVFLWSCDDFGVICAGTNISTLQKGNFGKIMTNSDAPLV